MKSVGKLCASVNHPFQTKFQFKLQEEPRPTSFKVCSVEQSMTRRLQYYPRSGTASNGELNRADTFTIKEASH